MTDDYKLKYSPISVKQNRTDPLRSALDHCTRVRIYGSKASGMTLTLVLLRLKMLGRDWLGCRNWLWLYYKIYSLKIIRREG